MKRLATVALAVLIVAGLSSVVVAERTALSITGGIQLLAAYEENVGNAAGAGMGTSVMDNRVEQKVNLDVDADMTDNITVHVGLEATGAWGSDAANGYVAYNIDDQNAGLVIDEAYVVVKELIIEQLTIKAGVQTNEYSLRNDGNAMFLSVPEAGAWKATLNYDPLYVDLIIAKVQETRGTHGDSDLDLYSLGVEYYLENKGKVQVIIFALTDEEADTSMTEYSAGVTYMVLEDLEVFVQLGAQSGKINDADLGTMAYNLGCEYTFSKVVRKPYVGISYQYFGADEDDVDWVNMGDVDETIVLEADRNLRDHNQGVNPKLLTSNYSVIRLVGGCEVDEKTKVDAGLGFFSRVDEDSVSGLDLVPNADTSIGTEIDVKVSHKLTDDLTVGAGLGYVSVGDAIGDAAGCDDEALIGMYASASLSF